MRLVAPRADQRRPDRGRARGRGAGPRGRGRRCCRSHADWAGALLARADGVTGTKGAAGPKRTADVVALSAPGWATGTKADAGPKRTADVVARPGSDWVITPGITGCAGAADGAAAGPVPGRDGVPAGSRGARFAVVGRGRPEAAGCGRPVDVGGGRPVGVGRGVPVDVGCGLAAGAWPGCARAGRGRPRRLRARCPGRLRAAGGRWARAAGRGRLRGLRSGSASGSQSGLAGGSRSGSGAGSRSGSGAGSGTAGSRAAGVRPGRRRLAGTPGDGRPAWRGRGRFVTRLTVVGRLVAIQVVAPHQADQVGPVVGVGGVHTGQRGRELVRVLPVRHGLLVVAAAGQQPAVVVDALGHVVIDAE